jgi:hypothetical protein
VLFFRCGKFSLIRELNGGKRYGVEGSMKNYLHPVNMFLKKIMPVNIFQEMQQFQGFPLLAWFVFTYKFNLKITTD